MISFDNVTLTYPAAKSPALAHVNVHISAGELVLVVGPTGSGKSTLLEMINGLVPHFTGGSLVGTVRVAGRATENYPPRDMADVVGLVRQDPQRGFVTDVVEDELAYTMESLAIAPAVMRRRVEETLDLLGLAQLRTRPLRNMSGGQQQRVAIGSVLTANPKVLVLDEPTSALDPQAAEEVLATLQRLVHDLGFTVVLSEHRLERAIQYADSVLLLDEFGGVTHFANPAEAMAVSRIVPPIVSLGRWAGWHPLPLTVRDARRRAVGLRDQLETVGAGAPGPTTSSGAIVATMQKASCKYGDFVALRPTTVNVRAGEIVAVIGRNGSGKSTLLSLLAGGQTPTSGSAMVNGHDPADLRGPDLLSNVGFVPQEPQSLLWSESVADECRAADHDANVAPGTTWRLLRELRTGLDPATHPDNLSEGSRLCLVLAVMLVADSALVLLDEPTRGLDYEAKRRLVTALKARSVAGQAIVLATHDVELIAELCTRVIMLAEGEVVLDEACRPALLASPMFAPQVGKIVAPLPYLTIAEVMQALTDDASSVEGAPR